jgi:hypothetical protein
MGIIMKNKVREQLKKMYERTQEKRKLMESQVYDAKIANQNFKELEYIVYSTIK